MNLDLTTINAREPRILETTGQARFKRIETRLTDDEAIALCTDACSDFAKSLAFQHGQYRRSARGEVVFSPPVRPLTPNQWVWVHALAIEELNRQQRKAQEDAGSGEIFPAIVALFERAADKLKFPRIEIPAGEEGVVRLALVRSGTHAGHINVTDGGTYQARRWWGRIAPNGTMTVARTAPPKLLPTLAELNDDPERFLAAQSKLHNRCCFCLQALTDARSVMAGYGERCSQVWSLSYPTRKDAEAQHTATLADVAAV